MKRPRQLELCGGAIGGGVSGKVNLSGVRRSC